MVSISGLSAELKVKMALVPSMSPSVSLGRLCGGKYYFLFEARVVDDHVVENDHVGGAAARPAATADGAVAAVPTDGGTTYAGRSRWEEHGRKREHPWR